MKESFHERFTMKESFHEPFTKNADRGACRTVNNVSYLFALNYDHFYEREIMRLPNFEHNEWPKYVMENEIGSEVHTICYDEYGKV